MRGSSIHDSRYMGEIKDDVYANDRVFLYLPHRVYLTRQDQRNGPMQPKRWRWAWWEYVFREINRYVDVTWWEYYFDDQLEAEYQAKLTQLSTDRIGIKK